MAYAHCMLDNLSLQIILIAFPLQQTRLRVTSYLHCLSCYVRYDSQNKQRVSPYIHLADCSWLW
jgi:hypothetical protein